MNQDLSQDNTDRYVEYINENILKKIDYKKLQESYGTDDKAYAKSVLNALSQSAVEIYGTSYFDGFDENEYVLLPGIVRSREHGNVCLALLEIDLQSSGEHCNTDFLVQYGCIPQFHEETPDEVRNFVSKTYGVYDYCYTLGIETDHHVEFENIHPDMMEILNTFEQYPYDFLIEEKEIETESTLPQNVLRGYVYGYDGKATDYWFENSAENMANFIMLNERADKIIITDAVDQFVLSTYGHFLDSCADMGVRNEVVNSLVPMQMGGFDGLSMKVWDRDMNEVILEAEDEQDMDFEQ